ncbi:MAG: hypothetical protein ACLVJ6_01255 [Merdibacter sp.]
MESETLIMEVIETLAKTKTVLLITHRLPRRPRRSDLCDGSRCDRRTRQLCTAGEWRWRFCNSCGMHSRHWRIMGKEREHEEKQG